MVTNVLNQARTTFEYAKACANAFHESNAPLFPLTVRLGIEQAQAQIHWIRSRRSRLEEQLVSNPADNHDQNVAYRTVHTLSDAPF